METSRAKDKFGEVQCFNRHIAREEGAGQHGDLSRITNRVLRAPHASI